MYGERLAAAMSSAVPVPIAERYAGGYYGRAYYGHSVARGAAVPASAATGWDWNQPYYGAGFYALGDR